MPNCTQNEFGFPSFDRRKIEASFTGGDVSSDGGLLLLRQADRKLGLLKALDAVLPDPRHQVFITHRHIDLVRQRVYGLALGYEDLNDHDTLRHDPLWQTAVERRDALASSPTLCRLEQRVDREAALAFHEVLLEKFIASFAEPPTELILDFDATDDRVHGHQEGRFFNGYYGDYCFLPLYVFCGEQLLVSYLRPSRKGAARHAWAILKLLVERLRAVCRKCGSSCARTPGSAAGRCCTGASGNRHPPAPALRLARPAKKPSASKPRMLASPIFTTSSHSSPASHRSATCVIKTIKKIHL